ncbi:MAG: glycosyltransferase, partial [Candidatus Micrarchaeota archaeon]|nr:glycosyltransferase [Candidatus Micrarchaeota archaeon]
MMDKTRVGLLGLADDYDRAKGQGIQKYMHEIYQRMKRLSKNIEIEHAGYGKTISPFGGGLSFLFGNMFVDFSNYDIVHNMDQKPFLPMRKGNAIWISTAHDFQPILAPEYNDTGLKEKLWQLIINYGMMRSLKADHLIARSTLTRDDAVKLGYDRSKITIINDGVDERYLKRPKRVYRNDDFIVGYLGAFRRRKNLQFAIEAANTVRDDSIVFHMWGKTQYMFKELVELARGNRIIRFMGFAPEERVVDIYDSFDAFVFPSVYEGFGIPIIEAQARGLPVIINKQGRIPSEVRKYCFEAKDPENMADIIKKLKQNGYNEKDRKKAMEYARSFTWEKEAEQT